MVLLFTLFLQIFCDWELALSSINNAYSSNSRPGGSFDMFLFSNLNPDSTVYMWFGGLGNSHVGTSIVQLNTLWAFDTSTTTFELIIGTLTTSYICTDYGDESPNPECINGTNQILGNRVGTNGWNLGSKAYLYGGEEYDAGYRLKSDLWKIETNACFASGNDNSNESPKYPTTSCGEGKAYGPGGRKYFNTFSASSNNLYLFGGQVLSTKVPSNDMWVYHVNEDEWCFLLGDTEPNSVGNYYSHGYDENNMIPSRYGAISFTYSNSGTILYVFGGRGQNGFYNDLWGFNIANNQWNWVTGSSENNQYGVYSYAYTKDSTPGARYFSSGVFDDEYFFLFGGIGYTETTCNVVRDFECYGSLNDLWIYSILDYEWKFISNYTTRDINQYSSIPKGRYQSILAKNENSELFLGLGNIIQVNEQYSHQHENCFYKFDYSSFLTDKAATCNGVSNSEAEVCSGNGECLSDGSCKCRYGFAGSACNSAICFEKEGDEGCHDSGTCLKYNSCNCTTGIGPACQVSNRNSEIFCAARCVTNQNILFSLNVNPNSFSSENSIGSRSKMVPFQESNRYIFFFGGIGCGNVDDDCSSSNYFNDMWVFDTSTNYWKVHPTAGSDPINGVNQEGVYCETENSFEEGIYPSSRTSTASNQEDGIYYMYGGRNSASVFSDFWAFDPAQEMWKIIIKNSSELYPRYPSVGFTPFPNSENYTMYPGSRYGNGILVLDNLAYIFFGKTTTSSSDIYTDFWSFNLDTKIWTMYSGSKYSRSLGVYPSTKGVFSKSYFPASRCYFAFWHQNATFVSSNSEEETSYKSPYFFIFGGLNDYSSDYHLDDLWVSRFEYDNISKTEIMTWNWVMGNYPSTTERVGQLYQEDYSTFLNESNNLMGGREIFQAEMVYSEFDNDWVVVIFGGYGNSLYEEDGKGYLGDVWLFSNKNWRFKYVMGGLRSGSEGNYDHTSSNSHPRGALGSSIKQNSSHVLIFIGQSGSLYSADIWGIKKKSLFSMGIEQWKLTLLYSLGISSSIIILIIFLIVLVLIIFFSFVKNKKFEIGKTYNRPDIVSVSLGNSKNLSVERKLFEVDYASIRLIEDIGSGGSDTTIFKANWKGQIVAVKMFRPVVGDFENNFEDFQKEVKVISRLHHPNIISFFGCTLKIPKIGILMEYCEHGDLIVYIRKSQVDVVEPLDFENKIRILKEISFGMEYLHDKDIIHRDLKSNNVLLDNSLCVKLIDFGLSRIVENVNSVKTRRIGTSHYMAPEIITDPEYSEKVDIFSFGIIMFEVLEENFQPYGNNVLCVELKVANDKNYRPVVSESSKKNYPPWIIAAMKCCWVHKPDHRPSFSELKTCFMDRKPLKPKISKPKLLKKDNSQTIMELKKRNFEYRKKLPQRTRDEKGNFYSEKKKSLFTKNNEVKSRLSMPPNNNKKVTRVRRSGSETKIFNPKFRRTINTENVKKEISQKRLYPPKNKERKVNEKNRGMTIPKKKTLSKKYTSLSKERRNCTKKK